MGVRAVSQNSSSGRCRIGVPTGLSLQRGRAMEFAFGGRRPLLCAARSMPASASTPMPSPAAYPPCGLSSVTRWWPVRVPFHSRTQPSFRTLSIASAMASSSAAVCLTRSSSVGRFAMRYCRTAITEDVSSGSTKRVHRAKNTDRKTTASVLPVLAIEPCTDAR